MRALLDSNLFLMVLQSIISVLGLLLMKASITDARDAFSNSLYVHQSYFKVFFGFKLYLISFLLWLVILSRVNLSVAYPFSVAVTLFFTVLASIFLLKESLALVQFFGLTLILIGVQFLYWPTT